MEETKSRLWHRWQGGGDGAALAVTVGTGLSKEVLGARHRRAGEESSRRGPASAKILGQEGTSVSVCCVRDRREGARMALL